jgi:hypothetical protein
MDVTLPKHHAWLSICDRNHELLLRDVASLACAGHVDEGDVDSHPRRISIQGIQPHSMDVVVSLAR